jgi:hypothetical protein
MTKSIIDLSKIPKVAAPWRTSRHYARLWEPTTCRVDRLDCQYPVDTFDDLIYTPGWLNPDCPKLSTLQPWSVELQRLLKIKRKLLTIREKAQISLLKTRSGLVDRAHAAFRGLMNVLYVYIPKVTAHQQRKLSKELPLFWVQICEWSLVDTMEKNLKIVLQGAMAYGTKLISGRQWAASLPTTVRKLVVRKCSYMRMRRGSSVTKAAEFVWSLFQIKRCWTPMSAHLESEAEIKHAKVICHHETEKGQVELDENAKAWLRLAADVVVPPGTPYIPGDAVPTHHACVQVGRGVGGTHAYVLCGPRDGGRLDGFKEEFLDYEGANLRKPSKGKSEGLKRLLQIYQPLPLGEPHVWQERERRVYEYTCKEGDVEARDLEVEYEAIPEPGKYRIITKGPGNLYTACRRFQKFMIRSWKKMPFSTMTNDFVTKLERLCDEQLDGELFSSGDYDSATDMLPMDATWVVLLRVLQNLGLISYEGTECKYSDDAIPILQSFMRARVIYPNLPALRQREGQLMGHPDSFPLLCIINLATYMQTFDIQEPWHRNPKTKNKNSYGVRGRGLVLKKKLFNSLMINGDDILFPGREANINRWERIAKGLGFVINKMKSYRSSRFAMINSVLYDKSQRRVIGYLPYATLIGVNVKKDQLLETYASLAMTWEGIENLSERAKNFSRQCIFRRKECFDKKLCSFFRPNCFLPKRLGGLGWSLPDGFDYQVNYVQRKLAAWMIGDVKRSMVLDLAHSDTSLTSMMYALKTFSKLAPSVPVWRESHRPYFGPLNENEDGEELCQEILLKSLKTCDFIPGLRSAKEELLQKRKFLQDLIRDGLASRVPPLKEGKVRNWIGGLSRIEAPRRCTRVGSTWENGVSFGSVWEGPLLHKLETDPTISEHRYAAFG